MTDPTPHRPDLTLARGQVQAFVAASAGSGHPPAVSARTPLTFLDDATEAKLAKRVAAGLPPGGGAFPRRSVLMRTVVPSAVLAVLDLAGLGAALAGGNTLLAVLAAVLFVVLASVAVAGARFVAGDPLRLTADEQRRVAAAGSWRSRHDWSGPLAGGAERGIVLAACDAARRITRTPHWRAGQIGDRHVHLDLARELDAVDAEAHRIGTAGHGVPDGPAWAALLDRVAALTAYASQVDGYEQRREAAPARGPGAATGAPLPGEAADLSEDEILALLMFLNATLP